MRECSLRGVTSNPAIFEKAILGSTDYDEQIAELAGAGPATRARSTRRSRSSTSSWRCDVLRPVWDEADGADGFVSLEVEPGFAHDTDATSTQARDFWERVDRPNLMIKIPGTEEGVPAIEEAIAAGINVNVTLLFSVESYTAIAEAYIRGMERRLEAGESLDVHSVASFFVSRVDTEVDKRLAALGHEDLRGIAAVANARAAYMRFKELFRGERFAALRDAGAPVQRPLWASTGVKDPHYPETKYVDTLVGPHTVNTMPMATLLACAEELEVTRRHRGPGPDARTSSALADAGHRHGRRDEEAAARRDREVRRAVRRADRRRSSWHARRSSPGGRKTIEASLPDELEPPIDRAGAERRRREDVASASGRTTSRSGAAPACRRSATGWAGSRSARRCSSTPASCTSSRTRPRRTGCTRRRAARAWAGRASAPR